jgi:hypothetical protein
LHFTFWLLAALLLYANMPPPARTKKKPIERPRIAPSTFSSAFDFTSPSTRASRAVGSFEGRFGAPPPSSPFSSGEMAGAISFTFSWACRWNDLDSILTADASGMTMGQYDSTFSTTMMLNSTYVASCEQKRC